MWKQDSDECLKRIIIGRNQESFGLEGKKKKLSLDKQGQACWLWTSYEEKDSEQKLKSLVEQKSFKGTETQNLKHLKTRQICDDYYDAYGTVYIESLKIPDKPSKDNLGSINQSMNKQSQIERLILKKSDSTPNQRSNQGQSSQSSSQDINQKNQPSNQQQKLVIQARYQQNNKKHKIEKS